jgi:hypothetical protein
MNARPLSLRGRLLLALAAVVLVVVSAAPGGGGGVGGGGGFGGAHPVHTPGGRRSSGGDGATAALILGGVVVCGILVFGVLYALKKPLRLTEIVLVLPGEKAIPELDLLMTRSDFSTPQGRAEVLRQLLQSIDEGDVRDGCVRFLHVSKSEGSHVGKGQAVYQQRMAAAGLAERPADEVIQARAGDGPSPVCLLGVITTLPAGEPLEEGGMVAARSLTAALKQRPPGATAALYLYYAPDPGELLTEDQARSLLQAFQGG